MSSSAIPPPPSPEQAAAMAAAARAFSIEIWTLLGVGTMVTILRTYSRISQVGVSMLKPDDYLVWVGLIAYAAQTGLAYVIGSVARGLANNGMSDAHRAALPPDSEEYRLRQLGSIITLCGYASCVVCMWSLKAAWLFFYQRLTSGLQGSYRLRINVGFAFVIITPLIALLSLLLSCRPFHHYWQINPNPGRICQPALSYVSIWVFWAVNVVTDIYVIAIPLPMLWQSSLPTPKKLALIFLFCAGALVIVCTTLRIGYIVSDPVNGSMQAGSWAVREWFVAVVTTNLPILFPLLRRWFKPVTTTISSNMHSYRKSTNGTPRVIRTFGGGGGSSRRGPSTVNPLTNITLAESEEHIVDGIKLSDSKTWTDFDSAKVAENGAATRIRKSVEIAVYREEKPHIQTPLNDGSNRLGWSLEEGNYSASARGPEFQPNWPR